MFKLSDKLKFSLKVSLSIVLAFLIPFSQGWEQAQVSAITIMLIATMGGVNQSILKGTMRVLGTLIGAIIGLTLIALFPQDRIMYLVCLSIAVTITLYLVRAYKGDPSLFMLTAMTMMMVFDNGNVDDVFLFAVDKVNMSIFGIVIYTLVGIFLWPENIEDSTQDNAQELSSLQHMTFSKREVCDKEYKELITSLVKQETILQNSPFDTSTSPLSLNQWNSIVQSYKKINSLLALEINNERKYNNFDTQILELFTQINHALKTKEEITIPKKLQTTYNKEDTQTLSHLQKAALLGEVKNLLHLHDELRTLAGKLNALHSATPTFFTIESSQTTSNFIWGDIEHIKGALISFMIFWTATFIWINFNPPTGFLVVTLATGLSVLTTFTPLKPSILITVFSFSFIFAILSYVFILPNLHLAWELALFIFFYSFISFYVLPPKLTVLFLIGLFTFGITNQMNYNFSVFLSVLLMFYMFLFILQFFYYLPFSTKPEYLFLKIKNRFFYLAEILFKRSYNILNDKDTLYVRVMSYYALPHLFHSATSMKVWASKINFKHFTSLDKQLVDNLVKESENFAYYLNLLYQQNTQIKDNNLIFDLRKDDKLPYYSITNTDLTAKKVEERLNSILGDISFTSYSQKTVLDFYENINLRKSVWISYFKCKEILQTLDLQALRTSKF